MERHVVISVLYHICNQPFISYHTTEKIELQKLFFKAKIKDLSEENRLLLKTLSLLILVNPHRLEFS